MFHMRVELPQTVRACSAAKVQVPLPTKLMKEANETYSPQLSSVEGRGELQPPK